MKKILLAFMLLGLFLSSPVVAAEELSCEDLNDLSEVLDEVADVLNEAEVGDIRGDRDFDNKLGELIQALQMVARVEDNDRLSDNIDAMNDIWDTEGEWTREEWNDLRTALDGTINSFERIYYKDCER